MRQNVPEGRIGLPSDALQAPALPLSYSGLYFHITYSNLPYTVRQAIKVEKKFPTDEPRGCF
ncbi:MAG: hypothetical protein UU84_C0043G0006 [Candidatus Yanofskybacteria bacterium GW2011_GWC2_41_9]|uniref:Uncharacterized protein n=1 Tax=Candidatus Yanofskybacteria bacterium GW2011_GWC2_41_9 TaxID=1619029 RepID=A0A0G0ZTV5_9BACT|nr:MAG: hypothetical protein UU84_C0043G0006 [Candidatus Yanofskybacteria bacterium GW2011_GWC2_41_9]